MGIICNMKGKGSLWQGGVRGSALLWSPLLSKSSRVALQRAHIVDWLPTLYKAVGGDVEVFEDIDGIDQWEVFVNDGEPKRNSVVVNIEDANGVAAIIINQWKLYIDTSERDISENWYGPSGREGDYGLDQVYESYVATVLKELNMMPSRDDALSIRSSATVKCDESEPIIPCTPTIQPCLFDLDHDPCERRNLAAKEPKVLQWMLEELARVNATQVPPINQPNDPNGNPIYWGRVITNFGDEEPYIAYESV